MNSAETSTLETRKFSTALIHTGMNCLPSKNETLEEKNSLLLIDTDFKFDNILGQGGFGSVYKEKYSGMDVAVKSFTSRKHLEYELYILKKMKPSEFYPKLYGYYYHLGHDESTKGGGIVMEFLPKSLHDVLQENESNTIHWESYYKIAQSIARALHFIHQQNLAHLDIKPSNLMLDANNQIKIIDFGSARFYHLTEYTPPEFEEKFYLSKKADIYSFGVTLREMATGKPPQDAANGKGVVIPASCPQKFAELINSCTDINPTKRPTAEDIDRALGSALAELALSQPAEIAINQKQCERLSR